MKNEVWGLIILIATTGCSLLPSGSKDSDPSYSNGSAGFRDSAHLDGNKAPEGLAPKELKDESQSLDPLNMRSQADYHFTRGEAFSMEGQHQKAIDSFRTVLIFDVESAQVPLRIAAEYIKLGMITQALEYTDLAIQRNPKYLEARLVMGGLFATIKSYKKAENEFRTVLKMDPSNSEAMLYLGAIFSEQKKYEEAIEIFNQFSKLAVNNKKQEGKKLVQAHLAPYYIARVRLDQNTTKSIQLGEKALIQALKIKPDHVESVFLLAQIYKKQGQDRKALALLERFNQENGLNPRVSELLADLYIENEKYVQAIEHLESLEEIAEDRMQLSLRIAMLQIQIKRFAPAAQRLQDIVMKIPDNDKIRFYLAAVYEEMGDLDQAFFHYRLIPSESQFYGESMVHAAYILKNQKKFSEAQGILASALQSRSDIPQLYAVQASLLDEQNKSEQAFEVLNVGVRKFPDNTQLLFFLGTIQERIGMKEESITTMEKVIQREPNHAQALNFLAFTLTELNRSLDRAEGYVARALKIEPKDGYILDTHGWILFKRGKYKEAIQVLEKAFRLQPNEAIIAEHLADAYFKLKIYNQARAYYVKAISLEVDPGKKRNVQAKLEVLEKQVAFTRTAGGADSISN